MTVAAEEAVDRPAAVAGPAAVASRRRQPSPAGCRRRPSLGRARARAGPDRVAVLGIRHHGPGSARSVVAELDRIRPDIVLIEGPADADPLLALTADPGMSPPVALLAYVAGAPRISAFWPFAVFSPEWQALRWAAEHQVPVRFCDLPASMILADRDDEEADAATDTDTDTDTEHRQPDGTDSRADTEQPTRNSEQPLPMPSSLATPSRRPWRCGRTPSPCWPARPGTTTPSAGGTT